MTSAYDLYKGTARSKRRAKVVRETSQLSPKKEKIVEPVVETPTSVREGGVAEMSSHRVASPQIEVVDKKHVEAPLIPSPAEEQVVESSSKEARQELFESVVKMTIERVENVRKNKKYLKAWSSFQDYNFGQEFSRSASDITMVHFLLLYLP